MPSEPSGIAVGASSPSPSSHRTSAKWSGWRSKFGGSGSPRTTPVLDDGAWDKEHRKARRDSHTLASTASIATSPHLGLRRRPSDAFVVPAQPGLASPQVSADRTSYGSSSGGAGGLSDGASSALTYPSPSSVRSEVKPINRPGSVITTTELRYAAFPAASTDGEDDEAVTPGEGPIASASGSRRGSIPSDEAFASPPRPFTAHPYAFAASPSASTLAQQHQHQQDPSPVAPLASDRAKGRPYGFYPGVDPASPSADKGHGARSARSLAAGFGSPQPSVPAPPFFEPSAPASTSMSPSSSSKRRFGRFGGGGSIAGAQPAASSASTSRRPSTTSIAQTPTLGGASSFTPPLANEGWTRRPSTGDASWMTDRNSRGHGSTGGLVSGLRRLMSSQGNSSSARSPSPPPRPHVHDEVQIVSRSRQSRDLGARSETPSSMPPPSQPLTSLNEMDLQAYLAERSQANRREAVQLPSKAAELLGLRESEHSSSSSPKPAASSRSLASAFRRPSLPGYSGTGGVAPDASPRTSFSPPWGGGSSYVHSNARPASASATGSSASLRMFAMGAGPRASASRSSLLSGGSIDHVSHEEAKRRSGLSGPVVLTLGPAATAAAGGRHRRQHSHSSALTTGSRHESIEELEAGVPPPRPRRSDEGPPRPMSATSAPLLVEGGAYGDVADSFNAAHTQRWSAGLGGRTRKDSGQSVLSARLLGRRRSSEVQSGGGGPAQGHPFPTSSASSSSRASAIDVRSSPRFSFASLDPNVRRRPSVATIGADGSAAAADEAAKRRSLATASPSTRWSGLFSLPKKMTTSSISRPQSIQQPGGAQAAPMSDDDFILGSSSVDYRGPNRQPELGALGLAPSPFPALPSEPLSPTSAYFARANATRSPEREPMELLPAWPERNSSVRHKHQHSVPNFLPPPPLTQQQAALQTQWRQRMRTESEGGRARDWPTTDPGMPRAARTARAPLSLADAALRSPRAATSRLAQAPMTASASMSTAASRPSSSYSDYASHSRRPTFGLDLQPDAAAAFDSIPSPHPAIPRLRPESLIAEPTYGGGNGQLVTLRRPSLQPSDLSPSSPGPTRASLTTPSTASSPYSSLRSASSSATPATTSSVNRPAPPTIELLAAVSPDIQPRPIPEEMPRSPEPRDGMFIDGIEAGLFFSPGSVSGSSQTSTPALGTTASPSVHSSPVGPERSQPASISRAAARGLGLSLENSHEAAHQALQQSVASVGVAARRRGSSSATTRANVPPPGAALAGVASPDRRAYAFV